MTAVMVALFFCVVAAFAVLVFVALPELKDDPDVVRRGEQYARRAREALGPVRTAARRARVVAEAAAVKVADSASSLTRRTSRARR